MKILFVAVFVLLSFNSKSQNLDTVKVRFILSDTSILRDTSKIYINDTGYIIRRKGWKPRKYVEGKYENDVWLFGYLDAGKRPFPETIMVICYYEIKK